MSFHDIIPHMQISTRGRARFSCIKRISARLYRLLPRMTRRAKIYGILWLSLSLFIYFGVFLAPGDFEKGTVVTIEKGMTLSRAAKALEQENVVRSPLFFKGAVVFFNGSGTVISGDYFFDSRPTFLSVAWRVARGVFGLDPVKLTIPEGANSFEIAALAKKKMSKFDSDVFIRLAQKDEGYLFPDTYHFLPNDSAAVVYRTMRNTFEKKITPLKKDIAESGHSLHDIITMASLLEEEAHDTETRRLISGVLWKRIGLGMPLQVDATFLYINGKNTFELTLSDLEDDSSPYNTYRHRGLPPGPISNPGLDAIVAAIYPEESPYLYYLADLSGTTHFSRTFEEHKEKKFRYLP